jgi:preprotein translocase subunit YajC
VIIAASNSGSGGFILIVVIAILVVYLLFVRPQRRRQTQQQQMVSELRVGDEVLTAGGIYGTISEIDGDQVAVEIAPQTEVRVARRAIAGVMTEPGPEEPEADEPKPDQPAESEESVDTTRPISTGDPSDEQNAG